MANYFDQYDNPSAPLPMKSAQPARPWWYQQLADGALLGQANRLQAATSAAKESMTGGLPFGKAYPQALSYYNAASDAEKAAHPIASTALNVGGSVLPMLAGGELVNMGLGQLGRTGQFLTGDLTVPSVVRTASGQFAKLGQGDKVVNWLLQNASKGALFAREGAQAGAVGAAATGGSIPRGAAEGGLLGLAGMAVAPAVAGLAKVADLPAMMPEWMKYGAAALGGGAALHGGVEQLTHAVSSNPVAAGASGAGATAVGAASFLAGHPELRDLLTRVGIMGGANALARPSTTPMPQATAPNYFDRFDAASPGLQQ